MARAEVAQALVDSGLRLGGHPGQSRALSLARAVRGARPAGPAPLSSPEAAALRENRHALLPWEHACLHFGRLSQGVCACGMCVVCVCAGLPSGPLCLEAQLRWGRC